jgi:hypothetical protein
MKLPAVRHHLLPGHAVARRIMARAFCMTGGWMGGSSAAAWACWVLSATLLGLSSAQDITKNVCFVRICFGRRMLDPIGKCGCYNQGERESRRVSRGFTVLDGPIWAMAVGFTFICIILDIIVWRALKRRKFASPCTPLFPHVSQARRVQPFRPAYICLR